MRILRPQRDELAPIPFEPYGCVNASSLELAAGAGDAHVYVICFEPGGIIGPHEAGYGQLLLALSGNGWVAGEDGVRHDLEEGQAALFTRGETHAKGSHGGMTALMVQVRDLSPPTD